MKNNKNRTIREKLFECERHVNKIQTAKKQISENMPLTVQSYKQLNDVEESFIDQLIFRFSKLQDTLGEKLFPSILLLSGEDIKRKTFIDILNRLEELEIVERIEWLSLREIRNDIAHEYSNNVEQVVDSITSVYAASDQIIKIYDSIIAFCKIKHPDIFESKE